VQYVVDGYNLLTKAILYATICIVSTYGVTYFMDPNSPSYMVYLGRNIPPNHIPGFDYVTDLELLKFLNEQSFFDSFTIWKAQGSWRGEIEDTCIVEVFDTDFDIIVKFAQLYVSTFLQEAVYIKISQTQTVLVNGENT
jgi:hypothetical protein